MTLPDDLRQTPLTAFNIAHGGRMVPFAGYEMPVQFPDGVLKEHLHCRAAAGLFDVSHMGQVILRPKSGRIEDAALALERLVPVDVLGLKPGRQRYGPFTADDGGILDDLMIANRGDHLFLVVNAACKAADIAHLRRYLAGECEIEEITDRALVALQGPEAEAALSALAPEVAAMRFMEVADVTIAGTRCIVARAGYTGEDGYEISVPADQAVALAEALLSMRGSARSGLAHATACGSNRAFASTATTSTPRPHRRKARSNGRSRRCAAMAACAPAAFPAPISSLRNWMPVRRAVVSGCGPKAARRSAKARCFSPPRSAASRSGR